MHQTLNVVAIVVDALKLKIMLSYGDRGATEISGNMAFKGSTQSHSAGGNAENMRVHGLEYNNLERLINIFSASQGFPCFLINHI
jgi:hypothetical protein